MRSDPEGQSLLLFRERLQKSLDGPIFLAGGEIVGRFLANAFEHLENRFERMESAVDKRIPVRRVLDQCESERLTKHFHLFPVHELSAEFDGIARDPLIAHGADT